MLDITNHRRDSLGLKYIYAVNSRRSNGLSIGINLNTDHTCNWRCIYCQVDNLKRGSAPPVQLDVLELELSSVIRDIISDTACLHYDIPAELGTIRDIAFSGNGEPTTCREFAQVVDIIKSVICKFSLQNCVKVILITNGSLVHRPAIQKGIRLISEMNGEIWFKLDSATESGIRSINQSQLSIKKIRRNLITAAKLCPLWIQTCVFSRNGSPPSVEEQHGYLQFISTLLHEDIEICGVHLYGIARPSRQKEARELSRLPRKWLENYAQRIEKAGFKVKISV